MNEEHYTTITVDEYVHIRNVISALRNKLQGVREHLEKAEIDKALDLLRQENEG